MKLVSEVDYAGVGKTSFGISIKSASVEDIKSYEIDMNLIRKRFLADKKRREREDKINEILE